MSGGQRQRICLARALVCRPDIIVLDEPTSALDMQSEALIQKSLGDLRGSVTVLIVAHRMTTLNRCDRIMVFAEGRLQAFDQPSVLLESNGFYREAIHLSRTVARKIAIAVRSSGVTRCSQTLAPPARPRFNGRSRACLERRCVASRA